MALAEDTEWTKGIDIVKLEYIDSEWASYSSQMVVYFLWLLWKVENYNKNCCSDLLTYWTLFFFLWDIKVLAKIKIR